MFEISRQMFRDVNYFYVEKNVEICKKCLRNIYDVKK